MNDQCIDCKIRKWCYREEPTEDWTCDHYKSDDDYVDFLDEDRPEEEKQALIGYRKKWEEEDDATTGT